MSYMTYIGVKNGFPFLYTKKEPLNTPWSLKSEKNEIFMIIDTPYGHKTIGVLPITISKEIAQGHLTPNIF